MAGHEALVNEHEMHTDMHKQLREKREIIEKLREESKFFELWWVLINRMLRSWTVQWQEIIDFWLFDLIDIYCIISAYFPLCITLIRSGYLITRCKNPSSYNIPVDKWCQVEVELLSKSLIKFMPEISSICKMNWRQNIT